MFWWMLPKRPCSSVFTSASPGWACWTPGSRSRWGASLPVMSGRSPRKLCCSFGIGGVLAMANSLTERSSTRPRQRRFRLNRVEADIEDRRGVGEGADGDDVDTGLGDGADGLEGDPA